jgi:hypothetical protein
MDGGFGLDRARACEVIRNVGLIAREAGLIVRLEPPLELIKPDRSRRPVSEAVLAARFADRLLLSGRSWPVPVYVLLPNPGAIVNDTLTGKDAFSVVAWAELDNQTPEGQ